MRTINLMDKKVKYLLYGGITALLEFVSFILIDGLVPVYIASVTSFLIGLVSSFLFNKILVFRKSGFEYKEVVYFLILGAVNSQVSALLTTGLVCVGLWAIVAKFLTIGFIAVWNYAIMNRLIFKQK